MPAAPPVPEKRDHAVLFGKVEGENRGTAPMDPPRVLNDPLFWLRDDSRKDPKVIDHLKKEKAYFEDRTQDLQGLIKEIYDEHISHIQETDMSAPYRYGPFLYYNRDVQGKSYKIHCRCSLNSTPGNTETEEVLLDVNVLSEGKSFCDVSGVFPSPKTHELVGYAADFVGDEVYTVYFIDNKKGVTDMIEATTGSIVWSMEETSFFYTTMDAAKRHNKIWRHVIGTPQAQDINIFTEDDELFQVGLDKAGDGQTLLIYTSSTETTEVHLLDLRKGDKHNTVELIRGREFGVRFTLELHGTDTLLYCTNEGGATNQKITVASRSSPATAHQVIVPHNPKAFIEGHAVFRNFMLLFGREGGLTRLWIMRWANGSFSEPQEVEMDEPVFTVEPVLSHMREYDTSSFRMVYSSMATPHTFFDVDATSLARTVVKVKEVGGGFKQANYVVKRLMATAPDGTLVPISIIHMKSLDLSKPHPCMLYAYGSYGISMDPEFSTKYLPYVERGMIYAVAHIRGGSELGREWYEVGGKYLTKRNTFSDYIACAESLIEKGFTTPSQLACEGRSAGGLLMGAVLNMRPDLFKVSIAGVPFVDVMTTMCDPSIPLTTGEWEEWGNPNEYKYFDYMLSYSPMNNVRAQQYPHIMVQAGLHDPRVAYWEPTKWVAKLRELKTDDNEVLLNMDLESGHFSAKDRYRYWKESAIQQAFVCKHLKAVARCLVK